ncbi:Thiosulfate sulfurtransferase sseB [Corynebacterium kutscheri]|uniref:Rhodanese-related sulfurtransferase n=1 Tax=Corynebacterium kutscheri TaxID=35755 RepID=A0A0F6R346_9CORY|nr:sulfurtransferase [Corynebacterium kutscheri]AKE42028.1 rhodanese-related sulfurtransferase [Corynebacterium kutscheri]VEH06134.1 Thiosulfate sulfurtransferase sseB [Corynebacterium kutscheri]VEH10369.1 Thiosulfate sulfurtransferase sseB [Corynebacterium kutscheri]VEH82047.1 Thiosulfate sulfurtransferase sseB [Corynebacterium kutscheri]
MTNHTITAQELSERIKAGKKQVILACLWSGEEHGGYDQYNSGHIPTALFCDPANALAGTPSSTTGRNPLPDRDYLNRWINRWGLSGDRQIVVYDNHRGYFAARAWWILKWAGIEDVVILDGGQRAWQKLDEEIVGGPGNITGNSTIRANLGMLPTATIEDVKQHKGILLDTRESNRFSGRKENLDLKAGHIPGAINVPTRELVDEEGLFKTAEELREIFAQKGITADTIDDVIIYSGSGNHSALSIIAMNIAGIGTPRHYIGGWSQWCANPKNPVETGF